MLRALASNYWGQSADGIYTFNWNAHSYVHRPDKNSTIRTPDRQLLQEMDARFKRCEAKINSMPLTASWERNRCCHITGCTQRSRKP